MQSCATSAGRQRGFSLIELMVSVTVGLVIVAALAILFANNSRARQEMDKTSQQIENGRYASQVLLDDLRLAGYWGEFNPASLPVPGTLPDPSAADVASLTAAMPIAVQGYHFGKVAGSSLPAGVAALLQDRRPNTDVLVLRRVSTCAAGPQSSDRESSCDAMDTSARTYFQTTLCQTQLSTLAAASQFVISTDANVFQSSNPAVTGSPSYLAKKGCETTAAPAVTRSVVVRIYYVANNNAVNDGIPTLKVVELGAGAFGTPAPVAEGIEAIQLEFGVDTNNDGAPDFWTPDPGNQAYSNGTATLWPAATAYPGAATAWKWVTAVKIHVLARNTLSSAGFTDTRQYVLGSSAFTDNTYGAYNDSYKRHVYSTAVRLMNVAGRLE
jgi:type IV pilus assembly protein PilW